MTDGTERTAWEQMAAALGGTPTAPGGNAPVPPGWDRLRDALTGSGPSRADREPAVEDPADDAPSVPGGWAQLRSALGGAAATTVLERPGMEKVPPARAPEAVVATPDAPAWANAHAADGGEIGEGGATGEGGAPGGNRSPVALAGRVWSSRSGKAAVAVVVAAAVAAGAVLAITGASGGLSAQDAFSVNGKAVSIAAFNSELSVRQTLYGIKPPATTDTAKYHTYLTSAAQAEAVSVLLDQVAPRQGVTVSNQTAQQSLDQAVSTQYGGDQTKFAAALSNAGLNQDQVLAEITHNLVYQKLFAKIVGSPTVTTAQVQQYFTQHQSQLAEPETRQISHIVVASQSAAQSIVQQLKKGTSFATLAAAQSLDTATKANGGQLGLYARNDLQAGFANAAFSAKVNVPFGPVQDTSGGWDVGVVTAIHPAAAAALNAATSTAIKTVLADQAQADAWDRWLGNQIKAGHIVYAAKYRPATPDAPPQIPIPNLTGETLAGVGPANGTAASSGTGPSGSASTGAPSASSGTPGATGSGG